MPTLSKWPQLDFVVVTTSVAPSNRPTEWPSKLGAAVAAAATPAPRRCTTRRVSYSSIKSSIVSPRSTISIGYGCSMIVGMPFGAQFTVGSSVAKSNASSAVRAAGVSG